MIIFHPPGGGPREGTEVIDGIGSWAKKMHYAITVVAVAVRE